MPLYQQLTGAYITRLDISADRMKNAKAFSHMDWLVKRIYVPKGDSAAGNKTQGIGKIPFLFLSWNVAEENVKIKII